MASAWVEIVGRQLESTLDFIEAVVRDCPDELWQANMWEVPGQTVEARDADGNLVTDREQHALAQWEGQPWGVAWHALEVLEANLTAYFVPWEPWSGFGGRGQEDVTTLSAPWTRTEMLGYIDYCRERAAYAVKEFMEERAATPIGGQGRLYGRG